MKNVDKSKQKIADSWIKNHGAASFDFKNKDILLYDGGLFAIEKEVKIKPKQKVFLGKLKETNINGKILKLRELKSIPVRRNGKILEEEQEYYKSIIWFEELDHTINYFKSMKRMLNKLGFKTNFKK